MGLEAANVINRTTGYDESHPPHITVSPSTTGWLGQNGSMPRSNRPRRNASSTRSGSAGGSKWTEPTPELDLERARGGIARRESAPDGDWMVRTMTAKKAEKQYICPGCSTAIVPGIAHLVVWSDSHLFGQAAGLAERRHWHTNCWTGRTYRYR